MVSRWHINLESLYTQGEARALYQLQCELDHIKEFIKTANGEQDPHYW